MSFRKFDPVAYTQARPCLMVGAWMLYLAVFVLWYWSHLPPPAYAAVGSGDPDVFIRLGLVRDWLQGGGWYNHLVANTNAPYGGTVSPWTRPQDVLLALFTMPWPSEWPMELRLLYGAGPLPALMGMGLVYGLWLSSRRFVPLPQTGWYTVLILGLTFILNGFFMPGNADHHGLMCLCWTWALILLLNADGGAKSAFGAGALLGLICWISPEGLAPGGIVVAWFGLLWLLGHERAKYMPHTLWGMALTMNAGLYIERPPSEWLVPIYDSLSVMQLWLVWAAATVATLLVGLPERYAVHWKARLAWGVAGVVLVLGLVALPYPDFFRGPLVKVDPYIFTNFLPAIKEAQPLMAKNFLFAMAMTLPVVGLLIAAFWQWWHKKTPSIFQPWQLGLLAAALLGCWGLCLYQIRWVYYLLPVQILMLVPMAVATQFYTHPAIAHLWPASDVAALPPERREAGRGLVPFLLLMVPVVLFLMSDQMDSLKVDKGDDCFSVARIGIEHGALDVLGKEPVTLLTLTDLGGEILFWTKHRIIASNYHREGSGIRYIWTAEKIMDEAALRKHLAQRKVQAILVCSSPRAKKEAVLERWLKGAPLPEWVERLPFPKPRKLSGKPYVPNSDPLFLRLR